jgi:hypothetical protein
MDVQGKKNPAPCRLAPTTRSLMRVRHSSQALVGCRVRRRSLHSGNGVWSQQRVTGLMRRRAGLPMMRDEVMKAPQCRVGLAPTLLDGLSAEVRRR